MLTETEMAIIQSGNTEEILAWAIMKDAKYAQIDKTNAWLQEQVEKRLVNIDNNAAFLVDEHQRRKAANTKRGKENQAKGNTEEQKRAAADMGTALKRVHDDPDVKAGKHGALLAACRRVCREFMPLTNKKNEMGKYEQYAPLTKAGGEKVKPETLATNYRKKYGARQPHKVSRRAK